MCSLPLSVTWNPSLCLARSCILSNKTNVASSNLETLSRLALRDMMRDKTTKKVNNLRSVQNKGLKSEHLKQISVPSSGLISLRIYPPSMTRYPVQFWRWCCYLGIGVWRIIVWESVPWTLCTGSNSGRVFSASLDQLPTRAQAHTWRHDQHPRKVLFESRWRAVYVRPTCLNWAEIRTKLHCLQLEIVSCESTVEKQKL